MCTYDVVFYMHPCVNSHKITEMRRICMNKKEKVECLMDAGLNPNESKVLFGSLRIKKE